MRNLYLCIILLFACSVNAQNLVVDGRSWEYCVDIAYKESKSFWFTIKGMTIFEGKECGILYYSDGETEVHSGYIYESEEDKRVYVYNTFQGLDICFFLHKGWLMTNDFSLCDGDTVPVCRELVVSVDDNKYVAYNSDSICVDGVKRARWLVKMSEWKNPSTPVFTVVEGIGNNQAGIFAFNLAADLINGYPRYYFLACYDGDRCIFKRADFKAESVSSKIEEVKADKIESYYYDLQGRRMKNPTKGLYIKNGKKVVVKK